MDIMYSYYYKIEGFTRMEWYPFSINYTLLEEFTSSSKLDKFSTIGSLERGTI